MQQCSPVRVLSLPSFTQRSGPEFVAALGEARQLAQQPISYMLIDPFDKTITEVKLRAEEAAGADNRGHWVNLHPSDAELQRVVQAPETGAWALMEDRTTGIYTTIIGMLRGVPGRALRFSFFCPEARTLTLTCWTAL